MAGGSILKMILKENKNNPKALKAVDEILNKAKDDSEIKKSMSEKIPKVQSEKVAKDDSGITKAKIQERKEAVRKELDVWAKENDPEEGWGLTDKRYKEIRLRKKFLEERSGVSWVEYLEDNGLKVVKKITESSESSEKAGFVSQPGRRAKDDSEVLEVRRKRMSDDILLAVEKAKLQKKAKDDSELLYMAENLKNRNTEGIRQNEALDYIKEFQIFLNMLKLKNENSNSVIKSLSKLDNILNTVRSSKKFNVKELNCVINEIQENKKGVDKYV
jgi:hypothetical protein